MVYHTYRRNHGVQRVAIPASDDNLRDYHPEARIAFTVSGVGALAVFQIVHAARWSL